MLIEYCSVSLVKYLTTMEKHRSDNRSSSNSMIIPVNESLSIVTSVLCALEALHTLRPTALAHRDIKAENILLGADNKWKLCDFGSVSGMDGTLNSAQAASKEQTLIDRTTTPNYRPPELWDIELSKMHIGPKVDMWMLGCLLYRICFGRLPFHDSKLQILQGKFVIPSPFDKVLQETHLQNKFPDIVFLLDLLTKLLVVEPMIRIGSSDAKNICTQKLQQLQQNRDLTDQRFNPGVSVSECSYSSFNESKDTPEVSIEDNNKSVSHGKMKLPKLGRMLGRNSSSAALLPTTTSSGLSYESQSSNSLPIDNDSRVGEEKPASETHSRELIEQLMIERETMEAKIKRLEELVEKQQNIIGQLKSVVIAESQGSNKETEVGNKIPQVEIGWATGWNSPSSAKVLTPSNQSAFCVEPSTSDTPNSASINLKAQSPQPFEIDMQAERDHQPTKMEGELIQLSGEGQNLDDPIEETLLKTHEISENPIAQSEILEHNQHFFNEKSKGDDDDTHSTSSSSDGGFDPATNFSIKDDSKETGPVAQPADVNYSQNIDTALSSECLYSSFDDESSHQRSPFGVGISTANIDLISNGPLSSAEEQLIDLNYEEEALPAISSRNPFNASMQKLYIESHGTDERNQDESTQLQSLIDRSLSHGRSLSSDAFGLDSLGLENNKADEQECEKTKHKRSHTLTDIAFTTDKTPLSLDGEDWSSIAL